MSFISLYFLAGVVFVFWMEWNWKQHVKTTREETGIKIRKKFGWSNRFFHLVCWPFGIVMILINLIRMI